MKISCVILAVMSGALTLGISVALASSAAPQQSDAASNTASQHLSEAASADVAKPPASTERAGSRQVQHKNAKANRLPLPASAGKTNRLKHPPNGHSKSTTAVPRSAYKSGPSQSAVATKKGSIQNKSVTRVSAVQRPNMFPSSSPLLDNVRHRGPNPALIGGLGSSKPRESGAINGSSITRKP